MLFMEDQIQRSLFVCFSWVLLSKTHGEENLRIGEPLPSLHSATFAPDAEPTIKDRNKSYDSGLC